MSTLLKDAESSAAAALADPAWVAAATDAYCELSCALLRRCLTGGGGTCAESARTRAWDVLHEGAYDLVPPAARSVHMLATCLQVAHMLHDSGSSAVPVPLSVSVSAAVEASRLLDVALMLCSPTEPLRGLAFSLLQAATATAAHTHARSEGGAWGGGDSGESVPSEWPDIASCESSSSCSSGSSSVPRVHCPSVLAFQSRYFSPQQPVVITGAMSGWRALTAWRSPAYLLSAAGARTVPVELGAHYMADAWSQRLMSLRTFITTYILKQQLAQDGRAGAGAGAGAGAVAHGEQVELRGSLTAPLTSGPVAPAAAAAAAVADGDGGGDGEPAAKRRRVGAGVGVGEDVGGSASGISSSGGRGGGEAQVAYLAQHPLFDQCPSLAADIITPDYCCCSCSDGDGDGSGVVEVNAWLGPAGTVSCLHYDEPHNLLCQVVGRKRIRLYAPGCSAGLYPVTEGLLRNTSQVDVEAAWDAAAAAAFPLFPQQPYVECELGPGEMLYIPPRWWHHVRSLSTSFSVSFWWR